jgi:hypothetical protein
MKFRYARQAVAVTPKFLLWFLVVVVIFVFVSCATTTSTPVSRRQSEEPKGLLRSLADQMTDRDCNVGRFICPYGIGPAGEACTCTDAAGVVLKGRTVK